MGFGHSTFMPNAFACLATSTHVAPRPIIVKNLPCYYDPIVFGSLLLSVDALCKR